jgi:hypothetical protein
MWSITVLWWWLVTPVAGDEPGEQAHPVAGRASLTDRRLIVTRS